MSGIQNQFLLKELSFFQWKTPLASNDAVEALWGLSVVLDGDTVRIAEEGEEDIILGVVRPKGSTAYHGDALHWQGKYLKDVWGNFLQENYYLIEKIDIPKNQNHLYRMICWSLKATRYQ